MCSTNILCGSLLASLFYLFALHFRWSILCRIFRWGNRCMKQLMSPNLMSELKVFLHVFCHKFCGMVTSWLQAKSRFMLFSFFVRDASSLQVSKVKSLAFEIGLTRLGKSSFPFLFSLRLISNFRIATICVLVLDPILLLRSTFEQKLIKFTTHF